jgi:hypothetical protein
MAHRVSFPMSAFESLADTIETNGTADTVRPNDDRFLCLASVAARPKSLSSMTALGQKQASLVFAFGVGASPGKWRSLGPLRNSAKDHALPSHH